MTEASRVQKLLIEQNARIIELERDLAAWRGIHEGAVLAMQERIKALEEALDDALGEWEGAQDWMSPHDKMVAAESISAYRKMLRREA